ncbi:MAG: glycyl-radical enzyme activating protein, partial [Actinomycetota bacterium]
METKSKDKLKRLGGKDPLILDIKGNSLDDGPGIRTVIFFKGCPLSCVWCHNPESKRTGPEISFDAGECIGCDSCIGVCERGALSRSNPVFIDRDKCDLCMRCVDECPAQALSSVGRSMMVEGIVEEVEKDLPFFKTSGGGVTLSGGEPTLFMDFASRLLRLLKSLSVHTLVETCGYFDYLDFKTSLYPYLDLIYYDLKLYDPEEHRKYCGVPNKKILENFR